MRKLRIFEHISLDGVIQSSGEDDFPYSDWTAPYRTPEGRDALLAMYGGSFDLLLGRRTYDMWSGFWPKAPRNPMSDGINTATKYVVTHRPESLQWGPFEARGEIERAMAMTQNLREQELLTEGLKQIEEAAPST